MRSTFCAGGSCHRKAVKCVDMRACSHFPANGLTRRTDCEGRDLVRRDLCATDCLLVLHIPYILLSRNDVVFDMKKDQPPLCKGRRCMLWYHTCTIPYKHTPHTMKIAACTLILFSATSAFVPACLRARAQVSLAAVPNNVPEEADVVVIGSGLAGLSCAALLAHCDRKVVVLESHDTPGGAAHTWTRRGFHFESGPSLYSGFSMDRSPNPLKNIFQIIGEDCEWITYDRWGTVLPNGKRFAAKIGPEEFDDVLLEHGGPDAVMEFKALMDRMKPLSDAAQALTSLALREDPAAIFTLLKYPKELVATLSQGATLNEPFLNVMNEMNVKNKFVKNWLDMLSFLLQGLPASGTMNAVMVSGAYQSCLFVLAVYHIILTPG